MFACGSLDCLQGLFLMFWDGFRGSQAVLGAIWGCLGRCWALLAGFCGRFLAVLGRSWPLLAGLQARVYRLCVQGSLSVNIAGSGYCCSVFTVWCLLVFCCSSFVVCWFVGSLACLLVGLLACWLVGLLACLLVCLFACLFVCCLLRLACFLFDACFL